MLFGNEDGIVLEERKCGGLTERRRAPAEGSDLGRGRRIPHSHYIFVLRIDLNNTRAPARDRTIARSAQLLPGELMATGIGLAKSNAVYRSLR
jgi:hypothetical protein